MASITTDGHTLNIDGKRFWMIGGTVHYARIPRELWRERLLAARQAGLNTIETPVVWSVHEPVKGKHNFSGQNDLAAFVKLVGELGLRCVLRLGPAVGEGYDLGGMPPWLIPVSEQRLRSNHEEFLSLLATHIGAVASQVKRLQATVTKGAPIVAVQAENEWFCDNQELADAYLGALARYIRESGFSVPLLNRNNLFASAEGEVNTWSGYAHLMEVTRQLRTIGPEHPPIVAVQSGAPDIWGEPTRCKKSPGGVARAIAEVLAAGGQPIVSPFHGGTHLGFGGGRLEEAGGGFVTSDADAGAPLGQGGERGSTYDAVKNLLLFVNSFDRVFTALEPEYQPATISPDALVAPEMDPHTGERTGRKPTGAATVSVTHCRGAQGSVAFLFADDGGSKKTSTTLLLPDGSRLPVEMGTSPVGWLLFDTHLHGRATLDYCSLFPLALLGSMFVCFGPAGATGLLSISGIPMQLTVPSGKTPLVEEHEGLTIVVCNEDIANATYAHRDASGAPDAFFIGAAGVDAGGRPILAKGFKNVTRVEAGGNTSKVDDLAEALSPTKVASTDWARAGTDAWADGSEDRYALIAGPSSMEALGAPSGYAWVRVKFKSSSAKKTKVALFEAADRVQLFLDGDAQGVVGSGPGVVEQPLGLPLKKKEHTLVGLVDNLGRFSSSSVAGRPKGVYGHLYEVDAIKEKPAVEEGAPVEVLSFRSPVFGLHDGDATSPNRLTWTVTHRKKSPLILRIEPIAATGLVLLNDEPVELISPGDATTVVMDSEALNRGKNVIQVALMDTGHDDELIKEVKTGSALYEGVSTISDGAAWSFGKWEQPAKSRFEDFESGDLTVTKLNKLKGSPAWWRCKFELKHVGRPLYVDLTGMSKGQLLLNGENLGRYFVSTGDDKAVPPQTQYYLPEPWLLEDKVNELMIFDEHGFGPAKVKFVSP